MATLAEAAKIIGEVIGHDLRFTRFRGDGWQVHLLNPRDFLWIAVYLNAILRSNPETYLTSRMAIGLGTTNQLGPNGLSEASGSAFVSSGRGLDSMATGRTLALNGDGTDNIQRCALAFVDDRIAAWSPEQAQVVRLEMEPTESRTHADMARILNISRQAVSSRLQAAGGRLMMETLGAFYDHQWEVTDA